MPKPLKFYVQNIAIIGGSFLHFWMHPFQQSKFILLQIHNEFLVRLVLWDGPHCKADEKKMILNIRYKMISFIAYYNLRKLPSRCRKWHFPINSYHKWNCILKWRLKRIRWSIFLTFANKLELVSITYD